VEVGQPTSLAELPHHATRWTRFAHHGPQATSFFATGADPRAPAATLVRVSDETSEHDFNEEVAYLHNTPVEVILANHLFVLLQVAALRLAETPPNLPAAQLVIDTTAAMVNAGGERLGEHVDLYRNAIAEIQQAYVRAVSTTN
jgi:hypothetical protein